MGNSLIAFLVAISACAWTYNKLARSTGGNTKNSLIATAIIGVFVFVIVLFVAKMIPS